MKKFGLCWIPLEIDPKIIDPKIIDLTRGITYERAKLSRWEKIKIFLGFMKEPDRVRIEPIKLMDLIPKVKNDKN